MRGRLYIAVISAVLTLSAATTSAAQTPPPPTQSGKKTEPIEPIPPVTDEDRAAAFPAGLEGHAVGAGAVNFMVLYDQLEWQGARHGGAGWENKSWIGGDINRLWIRTEGEAENGRVENAFATALWGRSFARWWDVVAGVRQDFRPGMASPTPRAGSGQA